MEEYILVKRTWLEKVLENSVEAGAFPDCSGTCMTYSKDGKLPRCIDCLQEQEPELFKSTPGLLPDELTAKWVEMRFPTPDIAKALHHLENMEKILDNNQLERGTLVIKDWLKELRSKLDV